MGLFLIISMGILSSCVSSASSTDLDEIKTKQTNHEQRILTLEEERKKMDLGTLQNNIRKLKDDLLMLKVEQAVEETTNYFYQFTPELCYKASTHWQKKKGLFAIYKKQCATDGIEKTGCEKYIDDMVTSLQEELDSTCR